LSDYNGVQIKRMVESIQKLEAENVELRKECDAEHQKLIHWMGVASDWSHKNDTLRKLMGELVMLLECLAGPKNPLLTGLCWCGDYVPHRKPCEDGRTLLARATALGVPCR